MVPLVELIQRFFYIYGQDECFVLAVLLLFSFVIQQATLVIRHRPAKTLGCHGVLAMLCYLISTFT